MTDGNSVAIVTGGASGIGLATVDVLLEHGWQVVGLDRNPETLATARRHAPHAHFLEADVCDEAALARVVEAARKLGAVRGLVTCAGIARDVPFLETSADLFRAIQDVNVTGTFLSAQAAARAMRDGGGGAIVTISSVSGLAGNVGRAAYGASKGAVVNLTRVMAVELAQYGIRVNSVAPGPVDTPMVAAVHTPLIRAQWAEAVPMARYGTPREIAEGVAFLLDPKRSGYITGHTLPVDGGFMSAGVQKH